MPSHPSLRVGGLTVPYEQATEWATAYLDADANRRSDKPYAYPAYDWYNADQSIPNRVTDADLLAPALLNVPISIRAFYGLQAVRNSLQRALPPVDTPALERCPAEQVSELVKPVYAVLDPPNTRPFGVRATILSKIMHRKRPDFLVLHDTWVTTCYQTISGAPVPAVKGRSRADYMAAISLAIREDLSTQHETWRRCILWSAALGIRQSRWSGCWTSSLGTPGSILPGSQPSDRLTTSAGPRMD